MTSDQIRKAAEWLRLAQRRQRCHFCRQANCDETAVVFVSVHARCIKRARAQTKRSTEKLWKAGRKG